MLHRTSGAGGASSMRGCSPLRTGATVELKPPRRRTARAKCGDRGASNRPHTRVRGRLMLRASLVAVACWAALALAGSVAASTPSRWPLADHLCTDRATLVAQRDRIADAATLDEARELALAPAAQADAALSRARWLAPQSASIRSAQGRLHAYAQDVGAASSKSEVAEHFGSLVQLAASPGIAGAASFETKCDYSTGEIIAIVLGFILGIIPGIILLILLC